MMQNGGARVVLVTGPSGAGRTTALKTLEDIGFEPVDNMPLSLVGEMLPADRPLALGVDIRNRDFDTDAILALVDSLREDAANSVDLLFLDARREVLIARYSETRRRHPLTPQESPEAGIDAEVALLEPIRSRATNLIDTSDKTVHETRDDIRRLFGGDTDLGLSVSVESFSYKMGLPPGADLVFDMRFLANPHWEPRLRPLDGRSEDVRDYVTADARFADAFDRVRDLLLSLLPAYRSEGKTHLTVAIGCTGGQHRSVAVAELLSNALAANAWRVSTRHRELERRGTLGPREPGVTP
ncbi:RNase adapter RapZ [Palleronia abyssalis]|uniref:Nucleotide-binding protein n=1 Tax=Palleronia abyssalis TaxID=1501240 RepID=A0A2R8BXQ5_9RHOB|nr:RNase adapter RapZ [Palleronia abyssalis]SPJ24941.1 Nucleotide-binding protein [Palleronia abyssalis]